MGRHFQASGDAALRSAAWGPSSVVSRQSRHIMTPNPALSFKRVGPPFHMQAILIFICGCLCEPFKCVKDLNAGALDNLSV